MSSKKVGMTVGEHTADNLCFEAHRAKWLEEHGAQWACVYKKELIAVAPTLDELLVEVDNADVPRGDTVIACLKPFEGNVILLAA